MLILVLKYYVPYTDTLTDEYMCNILNRYKV